MSAFAAVGDDGLRPVVWGVGATPEAARLDAREWLGDHGDLDALTVHSITEEQAQRVRSGDVSWPARLRVDTFRSRITVETMTTTTTETTETVRDAEDLFRDAIEMMRDAYRSHVKACADSVEARVREQEDGFDFGEIQHEDLDGDSWVIWTDKAKAVVLVSGNGGAYFEDLGSDGVVKGGDIDWSALAYMALRADVYEELDQRGREMNADTVAEFFGEDEDEEESPVRLRSPTCDHADGCERMALWRGLDEKGKSIATFCATHRDIAEQDPNGVVVWEVL